MIRLLAWIFQVRKDTIQFLLGEPKQYRARLALLIITTFLTTLIASVSPLFIKFAIDSLTGEQAVIPFLNTNLGYTVLGLAIFSIVGYTVLNFIQNACWWLRDYLMFHMEIRAENSVQDKFFQHLGKYDYAFLGSESNLRIIRNVQYDVRKMQGELLGFITKFIEIPSSILGFVIALFVLDWRIIVALLVIALVGMVLDAVRGGQWRRWGVIENREWSKVVNIEWHLINDVNVFLANGWFRSLYGRFADMRNHWQNLKWKQKKTDIVFRVINDSVSLILRAGVQVFAAFLVVKNVISIGAFSVFSNYSSQVERLLGTVGSIIENIFTLSVSIGRVDFVLNLPTRLDQSKIHEFNDEKVKSLELKNVSFRYPGSKDAEIAYLDRMKTMLGLKASEKEGWLSKIGRLIQNGMTPDWMRKELGKEMSDLQTTLEETNKQSVNILNGISTVFSPGKIYGIVGSNGAGKTTLMRILKRTLDPNQGSVLVDGRELVTIDPLVWRGLISSIEQQTYLIDGLSVRQNVLIQSQKPVEDAEILSLFSELGLPKDINLDAIIGEDVRYSGGQSQLLELARMLIDPRPILIIDEGTNQLDAVKEANAIGLIEKYSKNSIVFFISHRVTTIRKSSKIITLDKGVVETMGTPQELLDSKKDNVFKQFWKIQVED